MTEPYSVLPLREAVKSLGLDRHFKDRTTLEQIDDEGDDWSVRHFGKDAVICGDVDFDALIGEGIAGIVADGDLEIQGDILNWEIDTLAAFLWVRGTLRCRNIVFGCMDLVVNDHAKTTGLVISTYNHGHLQIDGDLHADRVIIDNDGSAHVGGAVYAKGWTASPNASIEIRTSDWRDEIRPEFRDEFFDREGGMKCGNGNVDLVKALLAGRDILYEDASRALPRK